MKLSVLMPIYNERTTVLDILDRVIAAPLPPHMDVEVIAVDDASDDGSWELLSEYAAHRPRVHVFRQDRNRGKGACIRIAVEHATGDLAIIQDADLEYNPRDYPRLLKPIIENEADVVYGSRFASSSYRRVLFFWHSVANKILTTLSNMATDLNLTDMETGYKAFRMSVLKTMPLRSNRFGIEPELTAKVAKRRLRIMETTIDYNGRTYLEGKKIGLCDAVAAVSVIIKYMFIDDLYTERYGEATLVNMELATRFTRWMMDKVRPYLKGTVLEVGAGIGNNVRAMGTADAIVATEPDPEYIRLLENAFAGRKRVTVVQWDVTCPPPSQVDNVDTVLCSNVLEHVEEEEKALAHMHAVLRDGGCLVLIVPAGARLFGSLDRAVGHFCRYDRNGLGERLQKAGFHVEICFSINKLGVWGWWLNSVVIKRRVLGRYQLKLFNMLVPVFRFLDPVLPWEGLSLVAVARKKGVTHD